MKRLLSTSALIFAGVFVLSGCVVRSYTVTRDRVNQDLWGNRGYIQGKAPAYNEADRKTTRDIKVVEIELHSPFKSAKKATQAPVQLVQPTEAAPVPAVSPEAGTVIEPSVSVAPSVPSKMQQYTIGRNDTLQKNMPEILWDEQALDEDLQCE